MLKEEFFSQQDFVALGFSSSLIPSNVWLYVHQPFFLNPTPLQQGFVLDQPLLIHHFGFLLIGFLSIVVP